MSTWARHVVAKWAVTAFVVAVLVSLPRSAVAYVGPGAGLSLLGSLVWLLVAVLSAIGIVLSWPVRVLIRRLRRRKRPVSATRVASAATRDEDVG